VNAYDLAYEDFKNGMKLKAIADKNNVSINTIKSWKRRHNWERKSSTIKKVKTSPTKKVAPKEKKDVPKKKSPKNLKQRMLIEKDLKNQLIERGAGHAHFLDLVNDYLALWDIKNKLIDDIEERGVAVTWQNGNQVGKKKNDSVSELNKTNAQMLKILSELGLKATELKKGENAFGNSEGDDEVEDV
jgi:phage terminase small subunit